MKRDDQVISNKGEGGSPAINNISSEGLEGSDEMLEEGVENADSGAAAFSPEGEPEILRYILKDNEKDSSAGQVMSYFMLFLFCVPGGTSSADVSAPLVKDLLGVNKPTRYFSMGSAIAMVSTFNANYSANACLDRGKILDTWRSSPCNMKAALMVVGSLFSLAALTFAAIAHRGAEPGGPSYEVVVEISGNSTLVKEKLLPLFPMAALVSSVSPNFLLNAFFLFQTVSLYYESNHSDQKTVYGFLKHLWSGLGGNQLFRGIFCVMTSITAMVEGGLNITPDKIDSVIHEHLGDELMDWFLCIVMSLLMWMEVLVSYTLATENVERFSPMRLYRKQLEEFISENPDNEAVEMAERVLDIIKAKQIQASAAAKGTGIGAVVGAVVGGAVGGLVADMRGAFIGLPAGSVIGGISGYQFNKQNARLPEGARSTHGSDSSGSLILRKVFSVIFCLVMLAPASLTGCGFSRRGLLNLGGHFDFLPQEKDNPHVIRGLILNPIATNMVLFLLFVASCPLNVLLFLSTITGKASALVSDGFMLAVKKEYNAKLLSERGQASPPVEAPTQSGADQENKYGSPVLKPKPVLGNSGLKTHLLSEDDSSSSPSPNFN